MDEIIIKFLANESSKEENEVLLKWIEESQLNKKYFLDIQKLFIAAMVNRNSTKEEKRENVLAWKELISKCESGRILPMPRRRNSLFGVLTAAAATILLFLCIGFYGYLQNGRNLFFAHKMSVEVIKPTSPLLVLSDGTVVSLSNSETKIEDAGVTIKNDDTKSIEYTALKEEKEIRYNTIKIPTATTFMLTLSDGTKVWLNSESELTYPVSFSGNERRVTLKGEGLFQVTKQKNCAPFIVESGKFSTRVLGTYFNVCCYQGDKIQHITLAEGSVKVEAENQEVLLAVGDQLKFDQQSNTIIKQQVDVSEYLSWIDGETWFNNTPLNELAVMIKRFYGLSVILSDESLASLRFSGKLLKSYDAKTIIDLISQSADLEWKVMDNSIILQRKN